jgi:hypothetical protein
MFAGLVVRFQHLHPLCIGREANVGNKRTTSKSLILVEFLNLTFDLEADIKWVSNVKFIPLALATLLTTGAASASSFIAPEALTTKLSPSIVVLGEPAGEPVAVVSEAKRNDKLAEAVGQAPLEYPFPGGKAPIVRASDKIVVRTPLNYPAPAGGTKPASPAAASFIQVSPSIIAMAAPEPAISFEEVASVGASGDEEKSATAEDFGRTPTVIRGGVVGEAGSVSTPAAPAKKPATVQRGSTMAGAQSAPEGQAAPQDSPQGSPKEPGQPIPSPTPAPPPANIIPEAKIR